MPQEPETDQLQNDRTSDSDYLKPFVERYPSETDPVRVCTLNEVETIYVYHITNNSDVKGENTCPVMEILGFQATALEAISAESNVSHPETGLGMVSAVEWRQLQTEGPAIGRVIEILEGRDNTMTDKDHAVNPLLKEKHRFAFRNEILFRQRVIDGTEMFQLVLPSDLRLRVLRGLYDDIGHSGRDKTIDLIRQRFYWPGMTADIEGYIRDCQRCIMPKAADPPRAPLVPIIATEPLELLAIDFLSLEKGKGGMKMCWS